MVFFDKLKQDATKLLTVFLVLHLLAVSFNRAQNRPGVYVGQVVLMTLYWPVQYVAAHGLGSVRNVWNHYFTLRDARAENEQLRAQLAQANQPLLEAQDTAKVAEQLDSFAKWRSGLNYPTIEAQVIARDSIQWFNTVMIDQGSLAGVQKDMPVVTPEGLVGRVIVVAPVSARVLLLTDERFGAGAIIGQLVNSRLIGVVRGKNSYLCVMNFVAASEKATAGEMVITSGQDGLFPRGIPLGRVRLAPGAPGVPQALEVEPAARLDKLDLVAVLQVPKEQIRGKADQLVQLEHEKQQQEKQQGRKTR